MADRSTSIFASLCILLCLALIGCNKGGENSPPHEATGDGQGNNPSVAGGGGQEGSQPKTDPSRPVVLIETSLGNITVRLDKEKAPLTVDNFLGYVDASHYDQTIIHQVYKDQGIVGGGYDVKMREKATRTPILNEARNGLKNLRGTISMVRYPDAIDSATCQFFINVSDNPALDYKDGTPEGYGYCVFGEIVEGMDVVDQINAAPLHDTAEFERTPVEPIVIKTIRLLR
ncbi:MAG: peptidylprolyl isomerase [Pirellulales bacterium]|nr:peptidylprolyl isomerase [Pirellulales bacterium]